MNSQNLYWFKEALRWQGSVIPAILPRVLLCGIVALLVSVLHQFGLSLHSPISSSIIPDVVLGLLLVFRTNTANERFWEGRKLWGSLVNAVRNLARRIWVAVIELEPSDREQKVAILRLLVAFAFATKLHLRGEPPNSEVEELISPSQYEKLKTMNNPPLEIAFWIGDYIQQQYYRNCLNVYQLSDIQRLVDALVDILGGCERILKTPMPLGYAIHLKQLLLIYCLLLPLVMVDDLNWWTPPVVALVSFTLFGVEEIGSEIENPFGYDGNDLPLTAICKTMRRNIEDLITLAPGVHSHIGDSKTPHRD
jgi:putative membrane protein